MKTKYLFLIVFVLALASCKTAQQAAQQTSTGETPRSTSATTPVQASVVVPPPKIRLQPLSIQALDLEEDITLADELVLTYSLTALDEKNNIVEVANASWGVVSIKKGEIIPKEKFTPIMLNVPLKGKILVSLVLTEIEDYEKAQQWVQKINKFKGVAQVPAVLVSLAAYETPIAVIFASVQAAGIGLQLADKYDTDDLLGQDTHTFLPKDCLVPQMKKTIPLTFKGEHFKNTFHYELTYKVSNEAP